MPLANLWPSSGPPPSLAPPPRRIPLSVWLRVLLGRAVPWMFLLVLAGGAFPLKASDTLASLPFLLPSTETEGTILEVAPTLWKGPRAYAVRHAYTVEGRRREGVSYTTSEVDEVFAEPSDLAGQRAIVEYVTAFPGVSRVAGMGRAPVATPAIVVFLVFPLLALYFLGLQLGIGLRHVRLLARGAIAPGELVGERRSRNSHAGLLLTFAFRAGSGAPRTMRVRSPNPSREEPILHEPREDGRADCWNALGYRPRVSAAGQLEPAGAFATALRVLLAVVALGAHAAAWILG